MRQMFFFCHLKVSWFFAVFGPKMDQKRVNPQFFGALGLCIYVPYDPRRERIFFSAKMWLETGFFRFGGSDPFIAPPGTPRGPGVAFFD